MPAKTDQVYELWADRPPILDLDTDGIARLTRADREERVRRLMRESRVIFAEALDELIVRPGKAYVGTGVLFSGGNDSTVLAHLARSWGVVDLAIHSNTGIGVEATREFVRKTCADWGWRLEERHPPTTYRELVLERGFPGPGQHFKMYQRLKERQFLAVRADLVTKTHRERVVYLAGRRKDESARRSDVPLWEREGSLVWCSPLALWTKLDMATYRLMHDDVPLNDVSGLLHMSAECLCGSFAKPDEYAELAYWPVSQAAAAEIADLEAAVHERCRECHGGPIPHERCRWGWGAYRADYARQLEEAKQAPLFAASLCGSC